MNKRQIKKNKDKQERKQSLLIIKNMKDKDIVVYISKAYWNKGKNPVKVIDLYDSQDFISLETVGNYGYIYLLNIKNLHYCNLTVKKSRYNKSRVCTYDIVKEMK